MVLGGDSITSDYRREGLWGSGHDRAVVVSETAAGRGAACRGSGRWRLGGAGDGGIALLVVGGGQGRGMKVGGQRGEVSGAAGHWRCKPGAMQGQGRRR